MSRRGRAASVLLALLATLSADAGHATAQEYPTQVIGSSRMSGGVIQELLRVLRKMQGTLESNPESGGGGCKSALANAVASLQGADAWYTAASIRSDRDGDGIFENEDNGAHTESTHQIHIRSSVVGLGRTMASPTG